MKVQFYLVSRGRYRLVDGVLPGLTGRDHTEDQPGGAQPLPPVAEIHVVIPVGGWRRPCHFAARRAASQPCKLWSAEIARAPTEYVAEKRKRIGNVRLHRN